MQTRCSDLEEEVSAFSGPAKKADFVDFFVSRKVNDGVSEFGMHEKRDLVEL